MADNHGLLTYNVCPRLDRGLHFLYKSVDLVTPLSLAVVALLSSIFASQYFKYEHKRLPT